MTHKPPFTINPRILALSLDISHSLGMLDAEKMQAQPVSLRRANTIRTIQASLAIEGNSLSLDQVSDILEGKRVIGPAAHILEVQNAIRLYNQLDQLNPLSMTDFLRAHDILMAGLVEDPGQWRQKGVGIFKGKEIAHVAPPAKRIPLLMRELFDFLKNDTGTPWLIKGCVFHYELEFIHPFMDGNGRMGRLWQQLILMRENGIFQNLPVEELIKKSQTDYYNILGLCDKEGESTKFIEYALSQIQEALREFWGSVRSPVTDPKSRLEFAHRELKSQWFSRKEYLKIFKNISTATASRDLLHGVEIGVLRLQGSKNQALYQFSDE